MSVSLYFCDMRKSTATQHPRLEKSINAHRCIGSENGEECAVKFAMTP